ncbi:MAG: phosphate regulon sensor histidine kinase PhoR [gamma proteobacterium symbiont of Taylorina sp.]|nr:phosphate regulon sensor histidine kinase PhoR [gamma proteobacterium symbiont of Taylorina sp.]
MNNFQAYIEAIPDAAVLLNEENKIIFFNRRAQSFFGLKKKKHLDRNILQIIDNPQLKNFLSSRDIEKKISRGIDIQSPANSSLFLSLSLLPCTNNTRFLLARNVSKIHRISKMRKDFVANVSHELRTPLTVIKGYLEVLEDRLIDDKTLLFPILEMQHQSQRMENLVQDLLMLSKLEANADKEVDTDLVQIPSIIKSLIKDVKHLRSNKNQEITSDIDNSLLIAGNEYELQSAFSNLINNAMRYTQENGNIHIEWVKKNKLICFSVSDNGEGIAKKHLHRLTERFYRVDKGRSRNEGGTGLGLAIVKHILNHHHASLEVTSTIGKGSKFCCLFNA